MLHKHEPHNVLQGMLLLIQFPISISLSRTSQEIYVNIIGITNALKILIVHNFSLKNKSNKNEKKWNQPGDVEVHSHEGFVSSHPGEDRDTDSEDEDSGKQLPIPIEEEPVEEITESPLQPETMPTDEISTGTNNPVQQNMETEEISNSSNIAEDEGQDEEMEEQNDDDDGATADTGEMENDE
ncbi:hypothetical protein JTB14_030606 [Gonioctena quinquepunctata]|nr:hypothetical protein JTB14_030606 [Gonioctena quinquepunctata]